MNLGHIRVARILVEELEGLSHEHRRLAREVEPHEFMKNSLCK